MFEEHLRSRIRPDGSIEPPYHPRPSVIATLVSDNRTTLLAGSFPTSTSGRGGGT
jgi:hypothetical protein